MSPGRRAARSTSSSGTVNQGAIEAVAAHYGDGAGLAPGSPVIIAGAASMALGQREPEGLALALAALVCAAGARTDVLLYTGDRGGCALLATAAKRLGWMTPRTARCGETGHGLALDPAEAHRGVALFHGGQPDLGTTVAAAAMTWAGVQVACWCDACGPVPLTEPCRRHSPPSVKAAWQARTWGARRPAA